MLRSIGCGKPHADRCFCIGAIMSLIVGKTRDTSLGGEFEVEWAPRGEEIFNHPISEMLANVCLGLGGKGFMVVLGIALYPFSKMLARRKFRVKKFSDKENFIFFADHVFF